MSEAIEADIVEEAAAWFVRLRGPRDEQLRAAFRAWLTADVRRAMAIDAVERNWRGSIEVATTMMPPTVAANDRTVAPRGSRRKAMGMMAGLAASVLLAGVAEWYGWGVGLPHRYRSDAAPMLVRLADGSAVRLAARSDMVVRQSAFGRTVTLETGAGAFSVAHEGRRRFVVYAGPASVLATGTRFSVARTRDGSRIWLSEGRVLVGTRSGETPPTELHPGTGAFVADSGRITPTRPASRMLMFKDTPLREAMARIAQGSRYSIRFANAAAADVPVEGSYRSGDPAAFLADLSLVQPIAWRRDGDILTVSSR